MHNLSTEKLPLLQDMVNTLQRECPKWNTLSTEYLLHNMLQNKQLLMQQCTHVDLNNIANIIKKYTFKDIFKKNATKLLKQHQYVNCLAQQAAWLPQEILP